MHKIQSKERQHVLETQDPYVVASAMIQLTERVGSLATQLMDNCSVDKLKTQDKERSTLINPWLLMESFQQAYAERLKDPQPVLDATLNFWQGYSDLVMSTNKRLFGLETDAIIEPNKGDKRFRDASWVKSPTFDFMKQSYLLWSKWFQEVTTNIDGLDSHTAHQVEFYSKQITDAFSPSNFPWSNPETIKESMKTGGMSMIQGLDNLLRDVEDGKGKLNIRMVNREAFGVGKNLATTPGKVVYQNSLLQLIQYYPTTEKAHKIPLMLVPPCINKFYIYDLRAESSFVRWAVDQGFTVFMVSWVNPDDKLAHKTYADYVLEGLDQAVQTIKKITKQKQINAMGFCIGGNFLSTLAAYYAGKNDTSLASTSYLATLFDFENAGDLKVFIDRKQLTDLENRVNKKGFIDGKALFRTFNLLRSNDLIWSYVINNYHKGQEPMAFDFLYWNADNTNLPAAMYIFYLKNMFLNNLLIKPGGITIGGVPIHLNKIQTPSFVLNTKEDHIAPWKCGFSGAQAFAGPSKFVLGGSGHVAGIFNPPHKKKYSYWVYDDLKKEADTWITKASEKPGSWWNEWTQWIQDYTGGQIKARQPGSKEYPAIEDAPGSYVLREL